MKNICIQVERNINEWDFKRTQEIPIFPFPGSLFNELSKKNTLSIFSNAIVSNTNKSKNYILYKSFKRMINNVDIFFAIDTFFLKFLLSNYNHELKKLICKKVIPILYKMPRSKLDLDFYKYKIIYKFSRAQIYTSISQFEYAKKQNIGDPIFLPIGIDTKFYNSKNFSYLKSFLLNKKYIVMHGDEERNNFELIKIADLLKIGIIRISQYKEKENSKLSIYDIASKYKNIKFLYHLQNVDFDDYIAILKNAYLYCGMVDSSVSPNGWTALCEAKALGLPIILNKGLTSEDFKKFFKSEDNSNFLEIQNVENDKDRILRFYKLIKKNNLLKTIIPLADYSYTSKVFQSQLLKKGLV